MNVVIEAAGGIAVIVLCLVGIAALSVIGMLGPGVGGSDGEAPPPPLEK